MKRLKKSSSTEPSRYVFVQKTGDDFTCIKLLEEKYKGIIFKYGDVGFAKDEKPDGTLPMRFKYDIIMNPFEKDTASQEFIDYIGDLLIELLEKQLTDGKVEFK